MTLGRAHHSTAVLLPDATVFLGGYTTSVPPSPQAEIFSPPYLFTGNPRPVISFAPTSITYGQTFTVRVGDGSPPVPAAHIAKVNLIRLGADTHSFDQNQRFVPLTFMVVNPTTLRVFAPADPNRAPPGSYMLFVVSDAGVGVPCQQARYVDIAPIVAH